MYTRALIVLLASGAVLPVASAATAVVSGRVRDAETGQTIPCTVSIRTADGKVITDHPSFRGGFRSSGVFEKEVPAGRTAITVTRGYDYIAARQQFELRDGERRQVEFRLRRRTPLRRLGWYCGDNHVHMIHGERKIEVDFEHVALAARAEGLDYLSLCQHWNLPEETPEALDRACARASTADFTLTWNLEAPKNYWRGDVSKCAGHGWTLGMRGRTPDGRDAIHELLAMSAWDYESEKPPTPNFESHALIHALGGIVAYTHPHRWWWGKWGGKGIYPVEERKAISNMAQELPFDTVAGPTYDAIDIMMQPEERETNRRAQELWFLLLNKGYRIPGTASSDTTFDNPGGGVPGRVRVYTRVSGAPTPAALTQAMKAGRNFITSGPLLLLDIGDRGPGDVIRARPGLKLPARIQAWAERLTRVELIRNGEVVRSWQATDEEFNATAEITESGSAWYIARCFGPTDARVAITNPIYFEAAGDRTPAATPARVTGVVRDAATGAALAGALEIIQMDGRKPVKVSEVPFRGGRFSITVPATARLRARANGYAPEMKSVFMDYAPLLEMMLNMRAEQLSDWNTFEKARNLLGQVRIDFALRKSDAVEPHQVAVVAHRGDHLKHPENTLPAFQSAIELGADYVEVDVRTTADGRLVVMHDSTVDRSTNGKGAVAAMTLEQIRALDAGIQFGPRFAGTRVPTLDEVLLLAHGRAGIYVDAKQASAPALVAALERHGIGGKVVVYGGLELLRQIAALRPQIKVMPEAVDAEMLNCAIKTLRPRVIAFSSRDFTGHLIAIARKSGAGIFVDRLGPADSPESWQDAINRGATGIQTDRPAELLSFLRARGRHK